MDAPVEPPRFKLSFLQRIRLSLQHFRALVVLLFIELRWSLQILLTRPDSADDCLVQVAGKVGAPTDVDAAMMIKPVLKAQ
jgi:hypothetical protein